MADATTKASTSAAADPAAPELIAAEYWREAVDGRVSLVAGACVKCGQHFLPRVMVCSRCHGTEFRDATVGKGGKLYCFTINHAPVPGFPAPYAVGYVDFPEGVRVFGHVRLDGATPPSIDGPVDIESAVLFRRPGGQAVRGYRFVPVSDVEARRS